MRRGLKHRSSAAWIGGGGTALLLVVSIYAGSRRLQDFDPAVSVYAAGSVVAAFAVGYRFALFAQRPATRMYLKRGAQLLFATFPFPATHLFMNRDWNGPRAVPARSGCDSTTRLGRFGAAGQSRALRPGTGRGPVHGPNAFHKKWRLSMNRVFDSCQKLTHLRKSLAQDGTGDRCVCEADGGSPRTVQSSTFDVRRSMFGSRDSNPRPGFETLIVSFFQNFILQGFIRRRGAYRWIMHLCLSGGGTLSFAITFPLVFGWVHFQSQSGNAEIYRAMVFGFSAGEFHVNSLAGFVTFNLLNFAALTLLAGLAMAFWRRLRDAGERATQSFREDFLPLLLLAAVTISGLMLTVSYKFMEGRGHWLAGLIHTASVLALLIYIPFGKLFHIVQRGVALAVSLHKKARANGIGVRCLRCGDPFASELHVRDLKIVLDQQGYNYRFAIPGGELHYQDVCPPCRRRLLALNQGRLLGR